MIAACAESGLSVYYNYFLFVYCFFLLWCGQCGRECLFRVSVMALLDGNSQRAVISKTTNLPDIQGINSTITKFGKILECF